MQKESVVILCCFVLIILLFGCTSSSSKSTTGTSTAAPPETTPACVDPGSANYMPGDLFEPPNAKEKAITACSDRCKGEGLKYNEVYGSENSGYYTVVSCYCKC